jgi:hypothetical protein
MRDLDELLKNAGRLEAPDSLKQRVMREIRADDRTEKPGWLVDLAEWLRRSLTGPARAGVALATVAVALAVAIGVHSPWPEAPVSIMAVVEMDEFLEEMIGPMHAALLDANGAAAESDDVNDFVTTHVESVFWIDGGPDNA